MPYALDIFVTGLNATYLMGCLVLIGFGVFVGR